MTVREVARAEAAAVRWSAYLGGVAAALGFAALASQSTPNFADRHLEIRFAVVCLAVGVVFAVEDPGGELKAALAVPLWRRVGLRLVVLGLVWVAAAALVVALGATTMPIHWPPISPPPHAGAFPAGRILLEAGTLWLFGTVAGVIGTRIWHDRYAELSASIVAGLFLIGFGLPPSIRPWQLPNEPTWEATGVFLILAVAVGVVLLIVLARDARLLVLSPHHREADSPRP